MGKIQVGNRVVAYEGRNRLMHKPVTSCEVAAPEGLDALLCSDAPEGVDDAGVGPNLATDDVRVRVHGLEQELLALQRSEHSCSGGAGRTPRDTSQNLDVSRTGLLARRFERLLLGLRRTSVAAQVQSRWTLQGARGRSVDRRKSLH